MKTLFLSSPFVPLTAINRAKTYHHLQPIYGCSYHRQNNGYRCSFVSHKFPLISNQQYYNLQSSITATPPSNEGGVSVADFENLMEKDWSFLDIDSTNSEKINQIIAAGEVERTSHVLISICPEGFVDRLMESATCNQLLVVHESLFTLACIKEKYDDVRCWQGELIHMPSGWASFDVVFLYFLPALPFKLDQILGTLARHCASGARVVISHPQGRKVVEEQRQQYPDVVISSLPDRVTLQHAAADYSFEVSKFIDEPNFYLAVLKFKEKTK